jgi:hypothetical protein
VVQSVPHVGQDPVDVDHDNVALHATRA